MPLQNFVDRVGPTISAAWLNMVDVLSTTVFGNAATNSAARAALCSDAPLEIANGGTGRRTAALAILGVRKTADTSRASNTTLAVDPELQITLTPGLWRCEMVVVVTAVGGNGTNNPGAQIVGAFSGTGVASGGPLLYQNPVSGDGLSTDFGFIVGNPTGSAPSVGVRTPDGCSFTNFGSILATSTGTFAVWWAQTTSNSIATVMKANSYIMAIQLA